VNASSPNTAAMTTVFRDIFRQNSRPLEPVPTGESPVLAKLRGVRAVLFDLYGTLLISGSGEVGTSPQAACQRALVEALAAVGIDPARLAGGEAETVFQVIRDFHAEGRAAGVEYPEVQVVEVWRRVLAELARRGLIDATWGPGVEVDLERLAVEYEARANPVWPMPGAESCLPDLHSRGFLLGIISNAQFYTPELLPAFLGGQSEAWGPDPGLEFYSYQHGVAKPGQGLFRLAAEELGRRGIEPGGAVCVGNDMLNDVLPARQVGFRTALFAGDARSLRRRGDDPRVEGVWPDLVLTTLADLGECIMIE
jgi:putative hydrolase of the HAD superfamily